ncbi:discoidin domain-containing receptor 2-like isoform X2 [Varroa jacobsoni]|uniref:discoidin domain-containing receptor 2-like isoform X2 n=1 Tax=Varroa jacobsoni TaxID=62625 RepID=UPI000BF6A3E9|nr:discoidin domain-containing receptor 2-like isoform X2 [Varroa jacobsoni]
MTSTNILRTLVTSVVLLELLLPGPQRHYANAVHLGSCNLTLGMMSGDIQDTDISCSSTHNAGSVGPAFARLNREINGGAWCPSQQISPDTYEWLEINLRGYHIVRGIATQGRFGNGQGREYAEEYMIEYWRAGINKWVRYTNRSGKHILEGNENTYTPEFRSLDPYIITDRIRVVPYSRDIRTVCMRIELYGCKWTQGIVSYTIPMGERFSSTVDLSDKTYDGGRDDSTLHDGLGQLTDGIEGGDNFKAEYSSSLGQGYEWVGWRNDSPHSNPLEMVFEFDSIRNFSEAYFYCNNQHTKDVSLFSSAKFWFSIGGRWYIEEPLVFKNMHNPLPEKARNVTIRLHHKIGRFVKLHLSYRSGWILLSEIAFISLPAEGNFTEEEEPIGPPVVFPTVTEDPMARHHIGILIGLLAAVIMLLILVIFIITVRHRQRKHTTPHAILKPMAGTGDNRVTINMKDLALQYQPKYALNGNIYGQVNLDDPDKLLYQEPADFKTPIYPATYSNADSSREYAVPQDITTPRSPKTLNRNASPPTFGRPLAKSSQPLVHSPSEQQQQQHYYAATDVIVASVPNIQGVSGNTVYSVPSLDLSTSSANSSGDDSGSVSNCTLRNSPHLSTTTQVREVPRHRVRILEKIGEGQYGEVHLAETEGITELVDVPSTFGSKSFVAIKSLRMNASESARKEFYKEVKILSRIRDPNISHILGVCTRDEPLSMIVEYSEHGDLNEFLNEHLPDTFAPTGATKTLSHGTLIFIATQIASGMKYLESLNFVHRDLATRNCLVGAGYTVKICDFAMSRSEYQHDYYRMQGGRSMLPVRWMSWEAILFGRFSTKSDVWAFAVTLWEMLTFARQKPFTNCTDDIVVENARHLYNMDGRAVQLNQPPDCAKEIFDLMRECWQRNESDRPNFREIHLFLQRKNLGYSPQA